MSFSKSEFIILTEDISLCKNTFLTISQYMHYINRADWGYEKPTYLAKKNTKGKIISLLGIKYVNLEGIPFLIPLKSLKINYYYDIKL